MSGPEERYTDNIAYCESEVRKHLPDQYLAIQFADPGKRGAAIALLAFACEIHRIPATVSEPPLGAIRQQWWREALDEIDGGGRVRAHPVVEALAVCLGGEAEEVRPLMDEAIDAMGWFLDGEEFADVESAVDLVCGSHGAIAAAVARILAGSEGTGEGEEAIRSLEAVAALARNFGPQGADDRSRSEGGPIATLPEQIHRLAENRGAGALADTLRQSHAGWRRALRSLPPEAMPAIAHAALLPGHLKLAVRLHETGSVSLPPLHDVIRKLKVTGAILTGRV